MPDILVTIPAYNEEETIGKVVRDIKLALRNENHMVIVVSDGSTDNTVFNAEKAGARVFHKPHSGLADTFRQEMRIACDFQPNIIVHTDADDQYCAEDIRPLLRAIRQGNDLVLGSRLRGHIEGMSPFRRIGNVVLSIVIRVWLWANVTDATTGLRAFTLEVAQLPINSDYTYTLEQIVKASNAKLKIKSIPVTFRKRNGRSRLMRSPAHYIWQTFMNSRKIFI